jgi:E3 ubiquitin-protein ligase RNF14
MSSTETFVLEYMNLPENSPERALMERRYGRANLRRLKAKFEEDQANKKWLDEATMTCPGCRIKVEKSHGCNHVRVDFGTYLIASALTTGLFALSL